jgi:hypothetical protein
MEEITGLIYSVNEKAAAATGVDMFKHTNKSALATKKLATKCKTEEDFGNLIDSLYFLVYEGTGDCKRLPSPPPGFAMDVKFLRTHLGHDVDHGDAADAAKKRRRGAALLRRYLGKPSLDECGPEEFSAGRLRILDELKGMLGQL